MMAIIVGIPENRVIGNGLKLPWDIPEDLKHFKEMTTGTTCIMGLATYNSIGKTLPDRNNIVLSFEKIDIPGADVCTSIPEAIEKAKSYGKDIFIMGGASIYKQFLPLVDKLYISHIKGKFEGDIYFPEYDESKWEVEHEEDKGPFIFRIWKRKETQ